MSSTCSEPKGPSSGYGCTYRYGIICLHANGISSLVGGRVCVAHILHTLFHIKDCLYRWHVNKLYHTCTYSCLPEDEPLGSEHVEDIVKIKILV